MNLITLHRTLLGAAALTLAAGLAQAQHNDPHTKMHAAHSAPAGQAKGQHAKPAAHLQKRVVTINGGYSPSSLTVKAGQPVQLTFKAGANVGCGDTIVIKNLGITRTLDKKGLAVVAFTPRKSGTLSFTCGMGMYKGQILVQ